MVSARIILIFFYLLGICGSCWLLYRFFRLFGFFFFKQKTAYEISACLVGSEMCIRDRINTLRDSQSEFCFRIGKSVSGDADAWCATYKFDKQSALPRKALPSDGIVPFLLKANPVENQFVDFKLIPSELYIG